MLMAHLCLLLPHGVREVAHLLQRRCLVPPKPLQVADFKYSIMIGLQVQGGCCQKQREHIHTKG
jgi:hypothetical protein